MYFVYLLRCADGTLYTGCTNDLDRRLVAHNAGKGAKYTRSRRPVVLVYREQAPFSSRNRQFFCNNSQKAIDIDFSH